MVVLLRFGKFVLLGGLMSLCVLPSHTMAAEANLVVNLDQLPEAFADLRKRIPDAPTLELQKCDEQDGRRVCLFRTEDNIYLIGAAEPTLLLDVLITAPAGSVSTFEGKLNWGKTVRAAVMLFSTDVDIDAASDAVGRLALPTTREKVRLGHILYDTNRTDDRAWRVSILPFGFELR